MPIKKRNTSWRKLVGRIKNFENIESGITSFVNPHSMLLLQDKNSIVGKIDNWHVDGFSFVKLLNQISHSNLSRYSFDETSLAPKIFNYVKKKNLKLAVIGTHEKFIQKAVNNIEENYDIIVCYSRHGYFQNKQEYTIVFQQIIDLKIDVVICGMGTPRQEDFLVKLVEAGWEGIGYTCGGFLHQTSNSINYYPKIIDNWNLRWLYRIYDEPKLIHRYLFRYPMFFLKFLTYMLTTKKQLD